MVPTLYMIDGKTNLLKMMNDVM